MQSINLICQKNNKANVGKFSSKTMYVGEFSSRYIYVGKFFSIKIWWFLSSNQGYCSEILKRKECRQILFIYVGGFSSTDKRGFK